MSNYIEISGITPANSFPKYSPHVPSNQICETDILSIPGQKPSMECILQVKVNVLICSHEVICTCVGEKLVIEGVKHINVMYVADEPCQSVHSAHFDVPFCMFILLKKKNCEIADIFAAIEHIKVKQLDCRHFSLSVIIFACPEFKKKSNPCKVEKSPYNNYCKDDCHNNYYKYKNIDYKYCETKYDKCDCKEHDNWENKYDQCDCKEHDNWENKYDQYDCKDHDNWENKYDKCDCKDHDNWKNKYDHDFSGHPHYSLEEKENKDKCDKYKYTEKDEPNYCCNYQVCKYCYKRDKCSYYK